MNELVKNHFSFAFLNSYCGSITETITSSMCGLIDIRNFVVESVPTTIRMKAFQNKLILVIFQDSLVQLCQARPSGQ